MFRLKQERDGFSTGNPTVWDRALSSPLSHYSGYLSNNVVNPLLIYSRSSPLARYSEVGEGHGVSQDHRDMAVWSNHRME